MNERESARAAGRSADSSYRERIEVDDLAGEAADHLARYAFAAHWVPGQAVADVCCGLGYGTNLLAAAGARKVYGVDSSSAAVDEARCRYGSSRIEFVRADATVDLPLPEVEVLICFEGIEHVQAPEKLLRNAVRCLTADSVALISTPNASAFKGGHSGNPYHVTEYARQEFEELLSRYFKRVKMFFQWSFDAPYDFAWGLGDLVRLATPVSLKHLVRTRLLRSRREGENKTERRGLGAAMKWRPYPASYLSLPGLRVEPRTWLAVCSGPKK
jgi:2-polyprenyl-3-methyl-5-hydroxy-6-metoxy-1,4-benzoquinol methylase